MGTGTTTWHAIERLGEKIRKNELINVTVIPARYVCGLLHAVSEASFLFQKGVGYTLLVLSSVFRIMIVVVVAH